MVYSDHPDQHLSGRKSSGVNISESGRKSSGVNIPESDRKSSGVNISESDRKSSDEKTSKSGRKTGGRHKVLYRVVQAAILISVLLAVECFARMSFNQLQLADYYNKDVGQLDKENAQVDLIIAGASQVYRGCNPEVVSEKMGIGEVIDCSTSAATNDGIYYMLRDLLERFEPQYVVINLEWNSFYTRKESSKLRAQLLASDCLRPADKIQYYMETIPFSDWPNMSAMYRYGGTVWGFSQLKANFLARSALLRGEDPKDTRLHYRKNGHCVVLGSCDTGNIPAEHNVYSLDQVKENEIAYIKKSVELCRQKGVKVFLMMAPTAMEDLYSVENYQEALDDIEQFARDNDCELLNFNLMKNREEILPDGYYSDNLHLNEEGAKIFSGILADTLNKVLNHEDVSAMFYEDSDALKKDVHRIVACTAGVDKRSDGTISFSAYSLQNKDITPEYRLILADREGNESELRPWQGDVSFTVDASEIPSKTTVILEARKAGETERDAYQAVLPKKKSAEQSEDSE